MNNDARFNRLMQRVAGMRQRGGFEYSFGLKPEEQLKITPPDKYARRIMSELEFAIKLDRYDENSGMYEKLISGAIDILEQALDADGALTRETCLKAEEALQPMRSDAKEYALILCGHAHIDMNWMWSYNETVAATIATFTTMCDLMDEYPEFCFSQSQASTYKIIEEHEPELMARMVRYIREGRWEVTAGAWVETDKNMPAGESLLNTVKYTKKYLSETWGVPADSLCIDFSPDTFGHSRHVPEIDKYSGLKYYYHCRGLDENYILYRYKGPSGAEMLMYREPYWYNSGITPRIGAGLPGLVSRMGGLKTGLIVYGVGDHGGGVTRRDIENALEMQEWPIFPRVRFGTFREFFALADVPEIREKLPVVEHELNFLFDGCYTTQSRIKRANRQTEAKLLEAQEFSALACTADPGFRYNEKGFETAWQKTLFTHFHDILTGSCVRDSRDYAMGLYQEALAVAETEEHRALRAIADKIDTTALAADNANEREFPYGTMSEGAGVGFGLGGWRGIPNPERGAGIRRAYNIFNPASVPFSGPVKITVWDWPGDAGRAYFTDAAGREVTACLNSGTERYWDHQFMTFLVKLELPAFGYTSILLNEREMGEYPSVDYSPDWGRLGYEDRYVLENAQLRAEFDMTTMSLISLVDKTDGEETLKLGAHSGLVLIDTQDNGMTAWTIGKYLRTMPVTALKNVNRFGNALRQGYSFTLEVLGSRVRGEVTLEDGAAGLGFHYSIDWNERSGETLPLLAFRLALRERPDEFLCDVPMGAAVRGHANHDIPALSYVCPVNKKNNYAAGRRQPVLRSDCKYGYRCFGDELTLSLINTAHFPDPVPERGEHDISIVVDLSDPVPNALAAGSERMMHPPVALPVNTSKGELPPEGTLLEVEGHARVSSVTRDENGQLNVRLNEIEGRSATVRIYALDGSAELSLKPYSIADAKV
ncbi:MAG: hypothetical protein J5584_03585 [Clostridia bacterium]|nr:hypothetical protein [Clostridia bacterium]